MQEFQISVDILEKLIDIGKAERFDILSLVPDFTEYQGRMMRLAPDPWFRVAESLGINDLIALIKSLTIAERELNGWGGGSVCAVIWLFKRLHGIDSNAKDELTNWILSNTRNRYVPFGTTNLGATSLDEYHALLRIDWERAEERRKAEEERRATAKQQKAQKATRNLIGAVRRKDLKAIQAVLLQGADPKAEIQDGVSALGLANTMGNQEILELLNKSEPNE